MISLARLRNLSQLKYFRHLGTCSSLLQHNETPNCENEGDSDGFIGSMLWFPTQVFGIDVRIRLYWQSAPPGSCCNVTLRPFVKRRSPSLQAHHYKNGSRLYWTMRQLRLCVLQSEGRKCICNLTPEIDSSHILIDTLLLMDLSRFHKVAFESSSEIGNCPEDRQRREPCRSKCRGTHLENLNAPFKLIVAAHTEPSSSTACCQTSIGSQQNVTH